MMAFCHTSSALSDPVTTLLSGDYDPATLMNSMSKIFGSTLEVLHSEKDDINDLSKDVTFWCSHQKRQTNIQTLVKDVNLDTKVDLDKPFTFIVHGWIDNVNRTWIKNMTTSE